MSELTWDKLTVIGMLMAAVVGFATGQVVSKTTYQSLLAMTEKLLKANADLCEALAQRLKRED